MGTKMSKKTDSSKESTSSNSYSNYSNSNSNNSNYSNSNSNSNNTINSSTPLVPDITSYETALRRDPSLQSFDALLRDRTVGSIRSVSAVDGPFSLDSLRHVTGSLVDINEQVVGLILQSKEDIWRNPELLDLVKDYFDSSAKTLGFYSALDRSLKGVRNSHVFVQLAISRFDEEKERGDGIFTGTLKELECFKSAGDPFTEEFFEAFRTVYASQVSMLSKLQAKKKKLDKKFKGLKSYRKVSTALFAAGVAALVICSVVAAAIAAPPLVAALVAASSAPLGAVGKWIDSLWKGYENGVRNELDLIFEMEIESFTAVKELETIKILVENLKLEIEGMVFKAGFAIREEDDVAVSLAIEEIKKNLGAFMNAVDVLGEHSDKFSRDVRRARAVILQRIIKFPSSG